MFDVIWCICQATQNKRRDAYIKFIKKELTSNYGLTEQEAGRLIYKSERPIHYKGPVAGKSTDPNEYQWVMLSAIKTNLWLKPGTTDNVVWDETYDGYEEILRKH